jgi:hypothetical protein
MYTRLSLLCVLGLVPLSLVAQDSTARTQSTPFRRGQWAAQFQAGTSFGSLGFIKFRSPTRALVLDVRLGGSHTEGLDTDSSGTRFTGLSSSAFTQLRFGWRRYSGGTEHVVGHYSFGLLAGFDHSVSVDASPGFESTRNGWTAGVFADVGGTYLVTSKFGIGALATAGLSYASSISTFSPPQAKTRIWSIGGSAISASLVATVFF